MKVALLLLLLPSLCLASVVQKRHDRLVLCHRLAYVEHCGHETPESASLDKLMTEKCHGLTCENISEGLSTLVKRYVKEGDLTYRDPETAKTLLEAAPMLACMELAQWYKGLVAGANDPAKVPLLKRAIAYGQRFLWLRPPDEAAVARAKQLLDECRGRVARLQPEIRPPGREFLPEMQAVAPTTVKAVAGGVELTCKTDTGRFWTRSKFKPPFQADFLVSVQSGDPLKPEKTCSIRLHYGPKGELMFNWEVRPDELRVQDISGDRGTSANGGCRIPNGKLTLITWIMRPTEMRVLVDGRELLTWPGAYAGVESPIDVTAARGSIVTVKSVIVRKLRK